MAEEAASTAGASEGNQGDEGSSTAGVPADGGAAGTQGSGESAALSQAEKERYEATIRELQSAKDREAARARELERKLSSPKPESTSPQGLTLADLMRVEELRDQRESLRTEFPEADASIFRDYLKFDSPEAMRVAAAESHRRITELRERLRAEEEKKVRDRLAAAGQSLPEPPDQGQAIDGLPTVEQINAMSLAEWDEYEKAHPGVIDRVLKANTPTELMGMGDL